MKGTYFIGMAIGLMAVGSIALKEFRPKVAAASSLDVKASCDKRPLLSQCSEYTEPAFAAGERFLKEPCGVMKGSFTSKACVTDEVVGTCLLGGAELRHYYADGRNAYTSATAARDCATSEGKFVSTTLSSTK